MKIVPNRVCLNHDGHKLESGSAMAGDKVNGYGMRNGHGSAQITEAFQGRSIRQETIIFYRTFVSVRINSLPAVNSQQPQVDALKHSVLGGPGIGGKYSGREKE